MTDIKRRVRCAVYTRKSSEEGLDMEFNSLDAQREAGEAYILSQRHEGWTLVPDYYDDGGYSAKDLERPAAKRLLQDIKDGKIDVVVVYKHYGERLDNERRRRHDVILQLLFDEGRKNMLYTPSQFCQAFENKAGLGGKHSIRDRIDVLSTKGYIKFNKDDVAKSKYGVMCVEGMEIPTGEERIDEETGEITMDMTLLLPTHFKQPGNGAILLAKKPNFFLLPIRFHLQ